MSGVCSRLHRESSSGVGSKIPVGTDRAANALVGGMVPQRRKLSDLKSEWLFFKGNAPPFYLVAPKSIGILP